MFIDDIKYSFTIKCVSINTFVSMFIDDIKYSFTMCSHNKLDNTFRMHTKSHTLMLQTT